MKLFGPTTRKIIKWLLLSLTVVLVLCTVTVTALYFFLKSKTWGNDDVATLAPYLALAGIELQHLGSAHIDLLRLIQIEDLKLQWQDAQSGRLRLQTGEVQLQYDFWSLLGDDIDVEKLELRDISLEGSVHAPSTPTPTAAAPPSDQDWLAHPPRGLHVKTITMANIALDVQLDDGNQTQRLRASLQQLNGQLSLGPGHWRGELSLRTRAEQAWSLQWGEAAEQFRLDFKPDIDASMAADLQLAQSPARWRVEATFNQQWNADTLRLTHHKDQHSTTMASMDSFRLRMNMSGQSKQDANDRDRAAGIASIFPLQITGDIKSSSKGLSFDKLHMGGVTLDGKAGHDMTLHMQGELDPAAKRAPDFQFNTDQTVWVRNAALGLNDIRAAVKTFRWHLTGKSDKAAGQAPVRYELAMQSLADNIQLAQAASGTAGAWQAGFDLEGGISTHGELGSPTQWIRQLVSHGEHKLRINHFAFNQGGQTIEFAKQQWANRWHYSDQTLQIQSDFDLRDLSVPTVKGKNNITQQLHFQSDIGLHQPSLTLQLAINTRQLLHMTIKGHDADKKLTLDHDIRLQTFKDLRRIAAVNTLWALLPEPQLAWHGQLTLSHQADSLSMADFTSLPQWPVGLSGDIRLTQARNRKTMLIKPLLLSYAVDKANDYRIRVNAQTAAIDFGFSQRPLPLALQSQWQFTWLPRRIDGNGYVRLQDKDALVYSLHGQDANQLATLHVDADLNLVEKWKQFFPELQPLGTVGAHVSLRGLVHHPFKSISELDGDSINTVKATVDVNTRIWQPKDYRHPLARIAKMVSMRHKLQWSAKQGRWRARFNAPSVHIPQWISAHGLRGQWDARLQPGLNPKHVTWDIDVKQGRLDMLQDNRVTMELGKLITPMTLKLDADRLAEQIRLNSLAINTGADLFSLHVSGNAGINGDRAQLDSVVQVKLREKIMQQPRLSGRGSIRAPLRFTMIPGGQATLEGGVDFDHVDIQWDALHWQAVNGRLKLEEELMIGKQLAKFRYLVNVDPFQRVDFSQIQPYLDEKQNLRFNLLDWHGLHVGPALASLRIKQNVFQLQQLDLQVLGGTVTGQMFLDVHPGAWRIGLLSRISGVDLRQLLSPAQGKQSNYAPVNARTALTFDLNQRLLEGQVNVTKISRPQLMQILEVVDPDHVDEQIALVRSALKFAYPKRVVIDMHRGLMDMTVDIAQLPRPMRIIGAPLSPLIQRFGGEWIDALRLVPLR